jgi:hypothetical protein
MQQAAHFMQLRVILFISAALSCTAQAVRIHEETPGGTPNGTLSIFTLANIPVPATTALYVNGLRNYQGVDYNQAGQTLEFTSVSIPQAGWTLRVDYDAMPAPITITIDAGGPGDQYFLPASTCAGNGTCPYSDPTMGAPPYDTLRYGYGMNPFSYSIPVPNGTCSLTLGFSEPNKTAAGQRVFTITANDQTVAGVDIFARAGAQKTAVTIPLAGVVVSAGVLKIGFTAQPGTWNAFVSSILAVCQPNP